MASDRQLEAQAATRAAVLLIEDDDILADVVTQLLDGIADVRWIPNAEDARDIATNGQWDLIVADIELPGMNGIEFIRAVRASQSLVATLILSGHASFDYAVEAIRAGADDYLTKPIDPMRFVEKVQELIALSHERRRGAEGVVLAIGAHPDDVEIGCGGILLRHAALGHRVAVLTLTGGEQGGEAAERALESQMAADLMSARLFHADLEDTSVSEGGSTINTIARVIEEVRPTTIYTHTIHDVHQDHRNVHRATLVAARGIPHIYCYQAPSTSVDFRPTRFVTIDPFVERKLEVIRAYASQVKVRAYLEEDLLLATARYWGRFASSRYVEPLEVARESDRHSPTALEVPGIPDPTGVLDAA